MKKIIKAITSPYLVIKYICSRYARKKQRLQEERWAKSDSLTIKDNEKVLFIDLGANMGQGYAWFNKYFNASNISFELFEPNPNCIEHLKKLDDVVSGKVKLHPVGAWVADGYFDFYGLKEDEGGKYSQGGSIVKEHNTKNYKSSSNKLNKVKVINFSSYLRDRSAEFDKIIVKMDIEGAEVDLLEALLKNKTINLINTLYVEFHSQYQTKDLSLSTRRREEKILKDLLHKTNVNIRIWH